jgi:hypothetical protein
MLFIMDNDTAFEFAAVADAASKDGARPALGQVQLSLERNDETMTLRAVATDSYMLANRGVTFLPGFYDAANTDKAWVSKPISVDAKLWKKALVDIAKSISRGAGHGAHILVDVTPEDGVIITHDLADPQEFVLRPSDHTFPNWKMLMGTESHEITGSDAPAQLPAFNPVLFGRITTLVSARAGARKDLPVRMAVTAQVDTHLKPWLFVQSHGPSELKVLLMPVRM